MNLRLMVISCIAASSLAMADGPIEERKKELVDELLVVIQAAETINLFANSFSQQMTQALQSVNDSLPDRAVVIIQEEAVRALGERVEDGSYHEMMYPIYDRHFTVEDLESIIAFYHTKAGRKYAESFMTMSQETLIASQEWAAPTGAIIVRRANQRMAEEGISISGEWIEHDLSQKKNPWWKFW